MGSVGVPFTQMGALTPPVQNEGSNGFGGGPKFSLNPPPPPKGGSHGFDGGPIHTDGGLEPPPYSPMRALMGLIGVSFTQMGALTPPIQNEGSNGFSGGPKFIHTPPLCVPPPSKGGSHGFDGGPIHTDGGLAPPPQSKTKAPMDLMGVPFTQMGGL